MKIPLLSLDPIDWLVYADWCADSDRTKAEGFARRVGKALRKMHIAGVEPKCALAFIGREYGANEYGERFYERVRANEWGLKCKEGKVQPLSIMFCEATGYRLGFFPVGEWRWMTPIEAKRVCREQGIHPLKPKLWCPADIDQPERHRRLITKFWRVVVRRATGIPDEVLNGADVGV